jgi:hypothetical protein
MLQHVVIRQESYVAGTCERPEVGYFMQSDAAHLPLGGQDRDGDLVWIKWSGRPWPRPRVHPVAGLGAVITSSRSDSDAASITGRNRG